MIRRAVWGVWWVAASLVGCGESDDGDDELGASEADGPADDDGASGNDSAPADDGANDDEGGEPTSAAQACVDTINEYRATLNLSPLQRWTDAEGCSDEEARSDSMTGVAHGAFGQCGESAQNECPGWPGPPMEMIDDCLALMWAEGPGEDFSEHGHYINMSSTSYQRVACGFHQTDDGSVWSVQNFQ